MLHRNPLLLMLLGDKELMLLRSNRNNVATAARGERE